MKLSKNFYFLLGAAGVFFLLAFGLDAYFDSDRLLKGYVKQIENHLLVQEKVIDDFVANELYILTDKLDAKATLGNEEKDKQIQIIEEISYRPFNICLFKKDSLLFWTNAIAFLDSTLVKKLRNADSFLFEKLPNGYFKVTKHPLPWAEEEDLYAVSLIPVKWNYIIDTDNLKTHFETGNHALPENLNVSRKSNAFPISDSSDNIVCYLEQNGPITDKTILKWYFALIFLAFLLLGVATNHLAAKLNYDYKPWVGSFFLIAVVFGIRFISIEYNWTVKFEPFQIFERSFNNNGISVGDLLINTLLLLWIVIFIHRASTMKGISTGLKPSVRFFLTTLDYLSVVLGFLLLISVFKSLVLNSGIPFDFKNVFNLDPYSLIAVLSIVLLLFTQFIFSHRMMMTIQKINLRPMQRLAALGTAIVIALPVIYHIELDLPLANSMLLTFVFILAFDLFIDNESPGLVWLVLWIILFSGIASGLLYHYNDRKEFREEYLISQALAEEVDPMAETAFEELVTVIADDQEIPLSFFFEKNVLSPDDKIEGYIFQQNYLYNNYRPRIIKIADGEFSSGNYQMDEEVFYQQLNKSKSIGNPAIRFYTNHRGSFSYILEPFINLGQTGGKRLLLHFERNIQQFHTVYKDLLSEKRFKSFKRIEELDYAIYKNGVLVKEEGLSADETISVNIPEKDYRRIITPNTIQFLYNHGGGTVVVLSKPKNDFFHPLSLFSYIFTILTLIILIFAFINSRLKILPSNFNFNFWNKPSLKNKIQFSTIFLTLFSFIIIALVSIYFLRNSWRNYHDSRLVRKVSSVQDNAEQLLHLQKNSLTFLEKQIEEISGIHRIDVNLYDRIGNLITSSEPDIFKRGILPSKMKSKAYNYLEKFNVSDRVTVEESTSNQVYTTAFVPIRDSYNQKIAYLGIPYSTKQRTFQTDVSEFMGNLLNAYVFLLLIAGGFSVLVANSITRPLSSIGEKLSETKLGKPNEPLEWKTNDEIGALIEEYNRMIKKLEHSALLLARSEREGAWREMAKQVAHEIKNPLTPMKLSIQYLRHAFQSNPENIEPLLKRVSNTLIEQIDSLSQIANEFSNFAKMPRANNQQLIINDLVESVHDLFAKREDMDIMLNLPDQQFHVFADENHLVRVFNNLLKNAIQAIPDDRRGKIEMSLFNVNGTATVKVEDNGTGIPEETQKKVFVPNFTTKSSGTGLGLAISKNIVESVNGRIYFETEQDKGTTFYVELPIKEKSELT